MEVTVKNRFNEIFDIEIDGWCYGIHNYPGEKFPGLIHGVVRELRPTFLAAIEHHYAFNILEVGKKISKASKYLVHEKEIVFSILAHFPRPRDLDEEGQYVMAEIVDLVEQKWGGALERLQRRWAKITQEEEEALYARRASLEAAEEEAEEAA